MFKKRTLELKELTKYNSNNRSKQSRDIIRAVKYANIEQVISLLTKVSDINIVDKKGNSLLHLAILHNQVSVLEYLLKIPTLNLDSCNKNKETPLTFAIKSGRRSLAQMMHSALCKKLKIHYIEGGVDVDMNAFLGRGTFGEVYKGKYNGQNVAVKKLFVNATFSLSMLKREIEAMQRCQSPYLLRLIAVSDLNSTRPKLILDYMDSGDLRGYLSKKKNKQSVAIHYSTLELAWAIANGLADIHSYGFIHRDLKSQNIFLCTKNYIKLADFGLTRDAYNTKTLSVGTPQWTAPEVFSSEYYGTPSDIYSFGVVLTELDTFELPYSNQNFTQQAFYNGVCNGKLRPTVSANCPSWYKNLVEKCLEHNPQKRPTAPEVIDILYNRLYLDNHDES
ncbi:kinase [Thraustotheca clavata]|uniref:Kinase n=1 Tax=Thraustotheca clavata TaxID=74557 RepID=A0A1W0AC16_9STRA|nr:kinase [Thraustotheca clavata]